MVKTSNPVQGIRGPRPRLTWPAWGVSSLAIGRTGGDLLRGPLANPAAANSSTMKGPRGLAGESCRRRCRAANDLSRWVRGCFYVRSPEMLAESQSTRGRNYAGSGEPDIRLASLPVTRDSDVICKMEVVANAGSSAAAGWLPVPGSGPLGASNAVERECGLSRSQQVGKRELVCLLSVCAARQWCTVTVAAGGAGDATYDERADGQYVPVEELY
jgi:hypothetical protein